MQGVELEGVGPSYVWVLCPIGLLSLARSMRLEDRHQGALDYLKRDLWEPVGELLCKA